MKLFLYVLLGMVLAYALAFLEGFGMILLGGAAFGLLLYIAVNISKNN
ncbi:hypothetical protein ACTWQB_10245 [Piscibacillus sp. B03]